MRENVNRHPERMRKICTRSGESGKKIKSYQLSAKSAE